MDEQLLKRNTDCVYFLASPLTCKKGIECEFRHNEIARLNPRDCWYWLSGSCLNTTCAFRHPPLDGHSGMPSERTHSSLPANKTMVPCYFFFNGFCNKGDRCSFLHGSDDSVCAFKPGKSASGSTDAPILENKSSVGNKTSVTSKPTETQLDPSDTAAKDPLDFKLLPKQDLQQPVPKNIKQQNVSLETPTYEYKEATVTKLESLHPSEGFIYNISRTCIEQRSEKQVNNRIESENRWESSPGFDVLVEPENLSYVGNSEYLPGLDMEGRELNGQYMECEFNDPIEYDPLCSEADILYEQERYDDYGCLDGEHTLADERNLPTYSREVILDSILSKRRIHMPTKISACTRNMDLRDHLRKRKEYIGRPVKGLLRRDDSSCLMVRNEKMHQKQAIDQRLSRGLTSERGLSSISSIAERALSISDKQFFRHSQQHRSRKHYSEKVARQQIFSSEAMKPISKERRSIHESIAFTGPKTLAQIKEEKKAAEENGHLKSTSADFHDPKPLSEILEDKKRLG